MDLLLNYFLIILHQLNFIRLQIFGLSLFYIQSIVCLLFNRESLNANTQLCIHIIHTYI